MGCSSRCHLASFQTCPAGRLASLLFSWIPGNPLVSNHKFDLLLFFQSPRSQGATFLWCSMSSVTQTGPWELLELLLFLIHEISFFHTRCQRSHRKNRKESKRPLNWEPASPHLSMVLKNTNDYLISSQHPSTQQECTREHVSLPPGLTSGT